jgi:hypothetical protein
VGVVRVRGVARQCFEFGSTKASKPNCPLFTVIAGSWCADIKQFAVF